MGMSEANTKEADLDAAEKDEFTSAKLMLGVIQKENDLEADRKKTIETRVSALLAFSGVLLLFFTNKADLSFLKDVAYDNFYRHYIIFTVFFVVPLLTLISSILFFVRVLSTREYKRLGLGGFHETNAHLSEDEAAMKLIINYREAIKLNSTENDKKTQLFKRGIYCLAFSLIMVIGMFIGNLVK